ncbi:hypothetical protein BN12_110002 [Nostocoides japonicum T1-X7]|uniref:Uncharacterized protein n=1 Tax=Nostocoides japonicum T1-X7 TaxID=1194083 RepID=A0A077LT48_9MICO|nr:hypothetical protein BN12_110002 [Tetrasphaera japonica T1-X7]
MTGLLCDLTARGLLTVPTPKRPSKPLGKNTLYKLLTNPYYAGVIRYKGALHPGAHEPLIDPALFDTVQSLLRARTARMTRHVQHAHHLKGLLHCGTCGSRMLLDFATNPRGATYAYFVCSGRAAKKTSCTRRAVPVAVAERLVADSYASITISDATYRDLAAKVDAAFDKRMAGRDQEIADLMANRTRLEAESDKLLAAHFADAIDLPTLKRHQDRIRAGLTDVNRRLAEHDEHHTGGRAFLHDSLRLLTDAHHAYTRSGDADRRLANQAFYTRLDITDDEQLRPRLAEPFATIIREAHEHGDDEREGAEHEHDEPTRVACSRKTLWVEPRGLEPLTPCLQSRCATNCAMAPRTDGPAPARVVSSAVGRRRARRRGRRSRGFGPQLLLGLLFLHLLVDQDGSGDGCCCEEKLLHVSILPCRRMAVHSGVCEGLGVGLTGLEPVTSSLSGKRSNRLSYRPAAGIRPDEVTPLAHPPQKRCVSPAPDHDNPARAEKMSAESSRDDIFSARAGGVQATTSTDTSTQPAPPGSRYENTVRRSPHTSIQRRSPKSRYRPSGRRVAPLSRRSG